MSDEKPSRPIPELQQMKIVQVDGPAPQLGMPSQTIEPNLNTAGPNVNAMNPKGVRLVMSKRELDAKKRLEGLKSGKIVAPPVVNNPAPLPEEQHPAPNVNIPYVFPEAPAGTTTYDRNAKAFRNREKAAYFNEDWIQNYPEAKVVSRAWLQTPVSISGFVSSEASFNSQQIHGLTMVWENNSLICEIKNPQGTKTFLVPEANVKILEFR